MPRFPNQESLLPATNEHWDILRQAIRRRREEVLRQQRLHDVEKERQRHSLTLPVQVGEKLAVFISGSSPASRALFYREFQDILREKPTGTASAKALKTAEVQAYYTLANKRLQEIRKEIATAERNILRAPRFLPLLTGDPQLPPVDTASSARSRDVRLNAEFLLPGASQTTIEQLRDRMRAARERSTMDWLRVLDPSYAKLLGLWEPGPVEPTSRAIVNRQVLGTDDITEEMALTWRLEKFRGKSQEEIEAILDAEGQRLSHPEGRWYTPGTPRTSRRSGPFVHGQRGRQSVADRTPEAEAAWDREMSARLRQFISPEEYDPEYRRVRRFLDDLSKRMTIPVHAKTHVVQATGKRLVSVRGGRDPQGVAITFITKLYDSLSKWEGLEAELAPLVMSTGAMTGAIQRSDFDWDPALERFRRIRSLRSLARGRFGDVIEALEEVCDKRGRPPAPGTPEHEIYQRIMRTMLDQADNVLNELERAGGWYQEPVANIYARWQSARRETFKPVLYSTDPAFIAVRNLPTSRIPVQVDQDITQYHVVADAVRGIQSRLGIRGEVVNAILGDMSKVVSGKFKTNLPKQPEPQLPQQTKAERKKEIKAMNDLLKSLKAQADLESAKALEQLRLALGREPTSQEKRASGIVSYQIVAPKPSARTPKPAKSTVPRVATGRAYERVSISLSTMAELPKETEARLESIIMDRIERSVAGTIEASGAESFAEILKQAKKQGQRI